MSEYDNTNRGSLFRNNKKEEDRHPDFNGSINVEGTEYWLNAWIKESKKDGTKFFSLSIKEKQDSPRQSSAPTRKSKVDDGLPF
jgi:uncharacterized protein (DUF736 family)